MRATETDDGWVRAASAAVVIFAVALPVSALLFYPPFGVQDGRLLLAAGLTATFVALHLGHVRHGLRDEPPPHGAWTFGAMVAVMVAGEVVIGPLWTRMFASLAASALLVFRPPWSVAWALGITLSCLFLGDASIGESGPYVAVVVASRAVTLFTLVWFVAGARRLGRARAALAERSVVRERARVDHALLRTLALELDVIEARAREAAAALGTGDPDAARAELEQVTGRARATLATARSAVAGLRDGGSRQDLQAAARLLTGPEDARA